MKSLRLYIILLSALLVVYLVAQFNRPQKIDWTETYASSDKIPFGTFILYNRLNDVFPGTTVQSFREPIYNVINDHGITHATYLIICKNAEINEYDFEKLKSFIEAGNDVFISAESFGDQFEKKLKLETSYEYNINTQDRSTAKILSGKVDSNKIYNIGKNEGVVYFSKFNDDSAIVIGANNIHHVNFIRYNLGKGRLFLHTKPLMFTNYSLLSKDGNEYASTALSFVHNNKTLIWDQYYTEGREGDDSVTRVLVRNDALRWAFYIALASLVGFVIYEIKRRQRIIPIVDPMENATLGFVSIVGQVYYEQHDNLNIANKKILYFLEHLRVAYNLKTTTLEREFIEGFSKKTGIDIEFAEQLINYINMVLVRQELSNRELINLNKLIEQFYIKSR